MRKILPSITTIGLTNSTWSQKISEVKSLKLYEIALFLTGLQIDERKKCYKALEELQAIHNFSIPFVHATSSMSEDEFWYIKNQFNTEYFNLHPVWEYPLQFQLSPEIRKYILIENSSPSVPLQKQDLEGFAGICFDLSHLEDSRRSKPEVYQENLFLTKQFEVLANHISAVSETARYNINETSYYSVHDSNLGNFQYLSGLTNSSFSNLCAIEVENSLEEQVSAKNKISNIIGINLKIAA